MDNLIFVWWKHKNIINVQSYIDICILYKNAWIIPWRNKCEKVLFVCLFDCELWFSAMSLQTQCFFFDQVNTSILDEQFMLSKYKYNTFLVLMLILHTRNIHLFLSQLTLSVSLSHSRYFIYIIHTTNRIHTHIYFVKETFGIVVHLFGISCCVQI